VLSVKVSVKERDFLTYADGRYVERTGSAQKYDTGGLKTVETVLINIQQYLISVAKEALAKELKDGFDPGYRTRVDNQLDKPVDNVLPLGKIQYLARQQGVVEIIKSVYAKIYALSRRVTGNYINMNWVFFNNVPIANSPMMLANALKSLEKSNVLNPGVIFHFVNIAEYARKMETLGVTSLSGGVNLSRHVTGGNISRGKNKGKPRRLKKPPNGTYWNTYKALQKEMAVLGSKAIRFEMQPGNYYGIGTLSMRQGAKRNTFATDAEGKKGRPYLYPMINVVIQEKGFTEKANTPLQQYFINKDGG
jgi:hypothetical protein